jgi:hypothetical protein
MHVASAVCDKAEVQLTVNRISGYHATMMFSLPAFRRTRKR